MDEAGESGFDQRAGRALVALLERITKATDVPFGTHVLTHIVGGLRSWDADEALIL